MMHILSGIARFLYANVSVEIYAGSYSYPFKVFLATFPIASFTISHTRIMKKASFSCRATKQVDVN